MSVVAENSYGWFICSKTFFDSLYCFKKDNSSENYELKSIFFQFNTPFLMDSETQKLGSSKSNYDEFLKEKVFKQKKKMIKLGQNIDKKESFIRLAASSLISAAKDVGYLENSEESCQDWFENNSGARNAAKEALNHQNQTIPSYINFESLSSLPTVKRFGSEMYLIPSFSSFEICDVCDFVHNDSKKYDLILIDPPWINKSVKRKKSYGQLKYDALRNLEVQMITNQGCLMVIWVTNSNSSSSFVLEHLFPKCNVTKTAIWYWCKVTQKGKFIYPLHSHHKKPYEKIILGRVAYGNSSRTPSEEIGPEKIIVSVPSSIHSHKPPLIEILKPYLTNEPVCLELFGRYLLPNWKTVGNEAIKLQNVKLFNTL